MKDIIQLPTNRTLIFIVTVYFIMIVLVLLWAVQILDIITGNNLKEAPVILVISLLFPLTLLVFAIINILRVFSLYKAGKPGSRLRLRLVISFSLVVIVSIVPVGILSGMFIKTSIDQWLSPENGEALKSAEKLAVKYYENRLESLKNLSESNYLENMLSSSEKIDAEDLLERLKDINSEIASVQIISDNKVYFSGNENLKLDNNFLELNSRNGPLPGNISKNGTVLYWQNNKNDYRIIISTKIESGFAEDVKKISLSLGDWKKYSEIPGKVYAAVALVGLFLTGPLLLMALLFSMAFGERIIGPLVALGEATGKIAEGDFSFKIISPGSDELDFLTESFNKMIYELDVSRSKLIQSEKVAAWQVIAQKLAHELRNPLTPIKLSAQRIQRKNMTDTLDREMVNNAMELILREVDGMDKLLQIFRNFAGGGPLDLKDIDLRSLLEEIIERFRTVEPSVLWRIAGEETVTIRADNLQIRQVFVNILKNAAEAAATEVVIRYDIVRKGTEPYVRIIVRDNGEGIEPERIVSVFQPYDSTRDRGSGLGLAVVQRIVSDHKGRIWLESEKGSGTAFFIDLPTGESNG